MIRRFALVSPGQFYLLTFNGFHANASHEFFQQFFRFGQFLFNYFALQAGESRRTLGFTGTKPAG